MRILYVTPRQFWPFNTGARLRDYHFARALGSRADLTLAYYRAAGESEVNSEAAPFCAAIHAVPPPDRYTPWKLVRGLVGRYPVTVLNYTTGAMRATLERIASGPPFDLIHLDGLQLAAFEPMLRRAFPRAPVVYNWHNIDSELMLRYSGQPDLAEPRAWYARLTAARIRSLEDRLLAQSWGHLVCSEREKEILRKRQPGCRVEVIENGVDTAHFAARGEGAKSRILFVGSMDYHANIEAAEWFTDHVWPSVRRHFPHLGFTIAGARPTEAIRALARIDGIEVTGTVPDLRPYYESAVAAVVPLWTGSGTRLKILEAMAASTPVVSTSIGAEGLEIDPGRNIAIANEPDQWLPALQTLINSPEAARRQAAAALELVRSRYDWESLGARLWETYRAWAAAAAR